MNKTPVSILQELMVQKKEGMPNYIMENCSGIPGVSFKCTVNVGQFKVSGYASTKKEAKQNSAEKLLQLFSNTDTIPKSTIFNQTASNQTFGYGANYVGKLNEFASTHGKSYPNYHDQVMPVNGQFVTRCSFLQWTTDGYGLKKKDSKQDSARKMLDKLRETKDIPIVTSKMQSIQLNDIEKINKLNQAVLKNYEILSLPEKAVTSDITEFQPLPNLKKNVTTLEELKYEMEKYGYKYTVERFQRSPCIMMMKIQDTNAVLMGKGDNKEQALKDLFESAITMFHHGFSLCTEL